jgi:nucleoid-associated protein YgaU
MLSRLAVSTILLVGLALVSGCSTGVPRTADPSSGDYYTEVEYQKLSKDQRAAYCAALDAEYQKQLGCVDKATSDLEKEGLAIRDLESELAMLNPKLDSLRSEVNGIEREIAYFEGLPKMYVVQRGDFLRKISGLETIYAGEPRWKRIYRANRSLIKNPNLIYPDQELTIPREWPHSHTVVDGESLWQIANYWEIYGDGKMWARIYEANKDVVKSPDLIRPGLVLAIPR